MCKVNLADNIWSKLYCVSDAYNFIKNIHSHAIIYIFGGVVRDYLNHSLNHIRDYDFVIKFNHDNHYSIPEYLSSSYNVNIIKNRYDGYKIIFRDDLIIDIWELKNTWAIKHKYFPPRFDKLLNTVYLNIDKFAYSLTDKRFLGDSIKRWKKLKHDNIIDIVFTDGPFEELNLLRAIVYSNKYKMKLSNNLKERFRTYSTQLECFIIQLLNLQESHYKEIIFDYSSLKNQIIEILDC